MSTETDRLSHIDEHSTGIEADPATTWDALLQVADGMVAAGAAPRVARLLGCSDVSPSGPRPLAVGSALPGFYVDTAEPSRELALAGRHRFSEYALIFRLEDAGNGQTRLGAETRAEFPGLKGRAYRTMVIGTGGHILVTRRLLDAVKRRAERQT